MEWYWWLIIGLAVIVSIPLKVRFLKWYSEHQKVNKNRGEDDE